MNDFDAYVEMLGLTRILQLRPKWQKALKNIKQQKN